MTLITSPDNPRISKLQRLHTTRGRKKSGFFLIEGPLLLEALLDAHIVPHEVYYQPELLRRTAKGQLLLDRLPQELADSQLIAISEQVLTAISDVQTAQGVVSVLPLTAFQAELVQARRTTAERPALLILDNLADPGNMGTILRTALAADVAMVLLTPDCVDCFNPKVVRAAAGAHLALPIATDVAWTTIAERVMAHSPSKILLAEANSPLMYFAENLSQPFTLIIGNEAHGPSPDARALATQTITIPLANRVESLNAAMATGIILYEAVRQRYAK
ncbi:MAG: RNA methyltransferase [Chloroflexi bacterium]|nr:MAG: RNA methyltransferase [Chloroflexota bacterium]